MLLAGVLNSKQIDWRQRYSLVVLCFFAVLICYIDRVSISIAIIPMAEQFGWKANTQGLILSCFYIGYLMTQFLGGYLSDRFGGKTVLAVGVVWWSVFTILTPPAAAMGMGALIAARILMGMGEGLTFPTIYSLYSRWVPASERARSMAFTMSGIPFGQIFALIAAPIIALYFGWEWIFYVFGITGVIWYLFWRKSASSRPDEHPNISESEIEEITAGTTAPNSKERGPTLKAFTRSMPVWSIVVAHFCNNWSLYVLLSWLPSYVTQGLGVDFSDAGWVSMLPHLVYFVFLNLAGNAADRMSKSGIDVTRVRKICQTIGFGGLSAALFAVGYADSVWIAITIMCAGYGLSAFAAGGFLINHIDVAPNHAGKLMGVTNTCGTIPGVIGVAISGYILETTGSWGLVFGVAGGITLFGLIFYLLFASGEKQFD